MDAAGISEYIGSMKVKTSITLERETLRAIDALAGNGSNRSRLIEAAVVDFVARRKRSVRERRDREILDRRADALNREALDVLEDQADL